MASMTLDEFWNSQAKPQPTLDDFMSGEMQRLSAAKPSAEASAEAKLAEGWGPWFNMLNGALLGGGKPLVSKLTGVPRNELDASAQAWEKENPGKAVATELGGSLATTLPLMALGQEYAALPLAANLGRAGSFLVGAARNAPLAERIGAGITSGALQGAEGAALTSQLHPGQSLGSQMGTGAAVGAALNPVMGIAGRALGSAIEPRVAQMAERFSQLGIPLRPEQVPGVGTARATLSKWFGGGVPNAEQASAFSRALGRTFGENAADRIDQQVIDRASARIGNNMTAAVARLSIPATDNTFTGALNHVRQNLPFAVADETTQRTINRAIDTMEGQLFQNGQISGNLYQSMTQKGGLLNNMIKSQNPEIKHIGGVLLDNLNDAMERAAVAGGRRGAYENLRRARGEWKNLKIAEELADETTGVIDPGKLLRQVEKKYNSTARAGDIGTLAEGGKKFLGHGAADALGGGMNPLTKGALMGGSVATGIGALAHDPMAIMHAAQNHQGVLLPMMAGMAGLYGLGKASAQVLNAPAATQRMLSIAQGQTQPALRGINPFTPAISNFYNNTTALGSP